MWSNSRGLAQHVLWFDPQQQQKTNKPRGERSHIDSKTIFSNFMSYFYASKGLVSRVHYNFFLKRYFKNTFFIKTELYHFLFFFVPFSPFYVPTLKLIASFFLLLLLQTCMCVCVYTRMHKYAQIYKHNLLSLFSLFVFVYLQD